MNRVLTTLLCSLVCCLTLNAQTVLNPTPADYAAAATAVVGAPHITAAATALGMAYSHDEEGGGTAPPAQAS
jgi:hypothetical protein